MKVKVDSKRCTGCGACVNVCPFDAIEIKNGTAQIGDACVICGLCLAHCPFFALSLDVDPVKRRKNAYV